MTKIIFIIAVVLVGGALAFIVGPRISNEALAVVIGAVCGISASIPVCIALVIATSESRRTATLRAQTVVLCEHGIDISRALCFACAHRGRYGLPMNTPLPQRIGDGKP